MNSRTFYFVIFPAAMFLSCSAGKINSVSDIQGTWISGLSKEIYREYNKNIYYQFIFQNDSFFVEIGVLGDDTDVNYEPFKAKGIFSIRGDYILFRGIAKREGSSKYNLNYEERFQYDYNVNYLSLYSMEKLNLLRYDMTRRYRQQK